MIPLDEALSGLRDGTLTIDDYRILRGLVPITDDDIISACASGAPAELEDAGVGWPNTGPTVAGESYPRRRWWQRRSRNAAPPIGETDSNEGTPT